MAEYVCDIQEHEHMTAELNEIREEIIRCRDCKWYAEVPCEHDVSNILYTCTRADFCMPSGGNGFCSWAERDDQ